MPRSINQFPPELLRLVLSQFKRSHDADNDSTFINALITSSLWREIGEELLWTDISLKNRQLAKFCNSNSAAMKQTRSLTIMILASDQSMRFTWVGDHDEAMKSAIDKPLFEHHHLSKSLTAMRRLECFSFRIIESDPRSLDAFFIGRKDINTLLAALPPSLRHLELDTIRYDTGGPVKDDSDHTCLFLRSIIPRLQNIRLRIGRICPEFIPVTTDADIQKGLIAEEVASSNTFIINTTHTSSWAPLDKCQLCTWSPLYDNGQENFIRPPRNLYVLNSLTPHITSAINSRLLPNFRNISLFDAQYPPEATYETRQIRYNALSERRLLPAESVTALPIFELPGTKDGSCFALRTRPGFWESDEVIGLWEDILDHAEHQMWVETVNGCRLPKHYFKLSSRFRHSTLRCSKLLRHDEYVKDSRYTNPLWVMEKREGHALLVAKEYDGLNNISWATREDTSRERQREERKKAMERGEEVEDDNLSNGSWDDDVQLEDYFNDMGYNLDIQALMKLLTS